jgi:hypothetical protein
MAQSISAGANIPLHWLGDPGDTNLATATEIEFAVLSSMQVMQELWAQVIIDLCQEALRLAGIDPAEVAIDPGLPDLQRRDAVRTTETLIRGRDAGLITDATARRIYLETLGVKNVADELARLASEAPAARADGRRDASAGTAPAADRDALDARPGSVGDTPSAGREDWWRARG